MKKMLILAVFLSQVTYAEDFRSIQRLREGDVISADVFNDILDYLELTLKPIDSGELDGVWSATQIYCSYGGGASKAFGGSSYCQDSAMLLPGMTLVNSLYLQRNDTITISANDDGTFDKQDVNNHQLESYHKIMINRKDTLTQASTQPEVFNILGQLKSIEKIKKEKLLQNNKNNTITDKKDKDD